MLCGAGCAGAHAEVVALARRADSADRACAARQGARRVRQSVRRRHDRLDRLLLGLRGDEELRHAAHARHRLPLPAVLSREREIAQVDIAAGEPGNRCRLDLGVVGEWRDASPRCCRSSREDRPPVPRRARSAHYQKARADLDKLAEGGPGRQDHPSAISSPAWSASSRRMTRSSPATSARRPSGRRATCKMNGKRRLIGSFNHGSMANAHAAGDRRPGGVSRSGRSISMSGDGGFTMMMGDFITLRQLGLPVKVSCSTTARWASSRWR